MASSSLARKNSVTDSVKERRLRPLYDLLDSGNCKKVLQEADKLLKKHPTFSCAKIIKSLAYMRLGKMEECMSIMNQVCEEVPTDEGTLHAMSICYRELDMPEKVCALFERACEVEKSEEHMTSWFMAHVRVLEFANQNKVAMKLYKSYSKGVYLLWAIMSLYAKAVIVDEPKIAESITLPLAARMIAKYIDENPSYTENDVYLYIMILFRMGDYGTALTVLECARVKVKCWTYAQYTRLEMSCLMKLKNKEKLAATLERNILHDPSDFKTYKQYIEVFGLSRTDHLIEFFKGIAYDAELKVKARTALLALILLAKLLFQNNVKKDSIELRSLFIEYFKKYGAKPFFLRDMKNVFNHVSDKNDVTIITGTMEAEEPYNYSEASGDDVTRLQWKANFECAKCFLKEAEILTDQTSVINTISSFVETYQSMDEQFKSIRSDTRDNCPYDDLLASNCLLLMKTFWNRQGYWTGYYLLTGMKSLNVGKESTVTAAKPEPVENGLLPSPTTSFKEEWFEGEFPIVMNMALLEFGVLNSPHWYPYRLLLGKTYFYCGAADAGIDEIMKMDIKHMQIDALGYLYIPKVLASGVLSDARRVLIHADSFYGSCQRELVEHIISAYKNLSWHQILEFMGFRESMLKSVQASQVNVEKRLFEYTMDGNTRENILKVAQRECYDFKSAFTTVFADNRDFSIYSFMFETPAGDDYKELTFIDSIEKLKIRASVLGIITNFVLALSDLNDSAKFRDHIANAKQAHDAIALCLNERKDCAVNFEDRNLFGPWPPSAYEYPESHIFDCFHGLLNLTWIAGSLSCKEYSRGEIEGLNEVIDCVSSQILETIKVYMTEWGKVHASLINTSNLNEELFLVVETLGFMCIVTDVLKGFLEKLIPSTSETKGRKKKTKDNAAGAPWVTHYNSLVGTLLSCAALVEGKLADLEIASAGWYFKTWSEEQDTFWTGRVPNNILLILKDTLPVVCEKLRNSFRRAYSEMKTTILNKKHFVETLVIRN